jgi:gas vesicle protein
VNQRAQRPWSITPSCNRLHTLEEHILELERTELRSETLRNRLEELAENRKELIRKIQDLTQTQLQEQLTNTLARIQNQLRTPRTGLQEATHSRPALDCCQNQISPEDTVEVETPFHKENQFELAKVVQTLENNIVLIRLRSTNKVLGSFGSKLRVLKDI